jgi:hypothetical protein
MAIHTRFMAFPPPESNKKILWFYFAEKLDKLSNGILYPLSRRGGTKIFNHKATKFTKKNSQTLCALCLCGAVWLRPKLRYE